MTIGIITRVNAIQNSITTEEFLDQLRFLVADSAVLVGWQLMFGYAITERAEALNLKDDPLVKGALELVRVDPKFIISAEVARAASYL